MARIWFSGFETGDFSECSGPSAGSPSAQSSIVRSGAYAVLLPDNSNLDLKVGLNLSTIFVRAYVYPTGMPTSLPIRLFTLDNASLSSIIKLYYNTDGTLSTIDNSGGLNTVLGTTSATLAINAFTLVELKVVISATVGIVELSVAGSVLLSSTGLTNNAKGNVDEWELDNFNENGTATGISVYYDDLAIDGTAYCGPGAVIARQFTTGTPTYNSWTKTGGSGTIDSVWNNTPFDTSKFAVTPSQTAAIAQTAITYSFSSTQTGHGVETVGASDTINAIKVGGVGKCSSTANNRNLGSIRARFNATDTDTNVTMTTSNAYYETAPFTDTLTHLNASEAGWNKRTSTSAGTQTVEDMWVQVDYTPSPNVNVNLSGVAATGAVTGFTPQVSVALGPVAATGAVASIVPTEGIPLAGVAATGAVAGFSVTISESFNLVGVAATGAVDSFIPGTAVTLAGAAANGTVGSFTNAIDVGLTGVAATGAVEAFSVATGTNATFNLVGVQAIGEVASFTVDVPGTGAVQDNNPFFCHVGRLMGHG